MDDPRLVCARLIREGAVARSEARVLDHADVRADVERRLADVGLSLATSPYSEHYGLRLLPEVSGDTAFDAASNLGLKADACALLVVLWARLVLQKRTATDTREMPGQASLLPDQRSQQVRDFQPSMRMETLIREFGPVIGSRDQIKRLVSQLRRLRFLGGHGETIEAGPLLELGIDGEKMIAFIKRRVLSDLLEKPAEAADAGPTAEDQLRAVLQELGGVASMSELASRTGERPGRLRALFKGLKERDLVYVTGVKGKTRYHLKSP